MGLPAEEVQAALRAALEQGARSIVLATATFDDLATQVTGPHGGCPAGYMVLGFRGVDLATQVTWAHTGAALTAASFLLSFNCFCPYLLAC